MNLLNKLQEYANIKQNIYGDKLSYFKTGGKINFVAAPNSNENLISLTKVLIDNGIPYYVIGNGSNTLISDEGFNGCIIKLNRLNEVHINGNSIYSQGGANLAMLLRKALENSLSGLEWTQGLPASIGGACCMNAGCFNLSIADVLMYADILIDDKITRLSNSELNFSYRNSTIKENNYIVLGCEFKLTHGIYYDIVKEIEKNRHERIKHQPQEISLGSVFKRENNESAGYYIDKLGYKGLSIGGAEVSNKHAGFIINSGNARSKDYILLASFLQNELYKNFNKNFKTEIEYVGYNDCLYKKLKNGITVDTNI